MHVSVYTMFVILAIAQQYELGKEFTSVSRHQGVGEGGGVAVGEGDGDACGEASTVGVGVAEGDGVGVGEGVGVAVARTAM